jgi:hypothetical protein
MHSCKTGPWFPARCRRYRDRLPVDSIVDGKAIKIASMIDGHTLLTIWNHGN